MLLRMAFGKRDSKFRLWFPLFILLPFLIIILLLMAPFLLLATVVFWGFGWGKLFLFFIPVLLGLICALRGLEIDIDDKGQRIFISIK